MTQARFTFHQEEELTLIHCLGGFLQPEGRGRDAIATRSRK